MITTIVNLLQRILLYHKQSGMYRSPILLKVGETWLKQINAPADVTDFLKEFFE